MDLGVAKRFWQYTFSLGCYVAVPHSFFKFAASEVFALKGIVEGHLVLLGGGWNFSTGRVLS